MPQLTEQFEHALVFTTRLHSRQVRKGSDTPYVAHLLGVAALVIEAGGDEDQAVAALLHDAVEDQGGAAMLAEIQQRFGERVARIVEGCTDADILPKPPWRPRKEAYLAHLRHASPEVRLVSLADKVYNARAILLDLSQVGDVLWERFTGGKDGTLWYYRALVEIFANGGSDPLSAELRRVVSAIELEAGQP